MKKSAERKGKIPLIIKLIVAAICAVSIFSSIQLGVTISQQKHELDLLNTQIAEQTLQNREISQLITSADDGYMERMAREKLGYVYPQERVYVDVSGN
jgi:cell division protein FtsB